MSTVIRLITAEELWQMPQNERRELLRGEVRTMSPTGFRHGKVVVNLSLLLATHVMKERLGAVVGGETGFVLARNPDLVRAVDVGFVRADRVPAADYSEKYWEGAPDLAVEVVSPSDTVEDIDDKVADYLEAGTRMVWVVNPRRKTVACYRPGSNPVLIHANELLDGQDVLPGFRCTVAELFL